MLKSPSKNKTDKYRFTPLKTMEDGRSEMGELSVLASVITSHSYQTESSPFNQFNLLVA